MARDVYEGIAALRNVDGLLEPLSGIRVYVYDRGTTNLATIYQGSTGATQGPTPGSGATNGPNPFTTGPSGAIEFWADGPKPLDVKIEDTQGPARIAVRTIGWNPFPADDGVITLAKLDAAVVAAFMPASKTYKFYTSHSFLVAGAVAVPSGQIDSIPKMFVGEFAGQQDVRLTHVYFAIGGGTSATFSMKRNGSDITGLTGIVATTSLGTDTPTSSTPLTDQDSIQPVVTAVSGSPVNLSVTVILEHTVHPI